MTERVIKLAPASEIEMRPHGSHETYQWGPWRLDPTTLVLYPVEPYRYEVDLERCLNSAQVLDYIAQVAGKTWADDATLAGLVRAIDDVMYLQNCVCSGGRSKTITRAQVGEMVKSAIKAGAPTDHDEEQ